MITGLLIAILVAEVIGRVMQINDSITVRKLNQQTQKRVSQWNEESLRIRREELRNLADLAKGSDTLQQFLKEIESEKKK